MTRRQLLENLDPWELCLWKAKQRIDGPIDDGFRSDARAARVASVVQASVGSKCSIADHMPHWKPKPKQTREQMAAMFKVAEALWPKPKGA